MRCRYISIRRLLRGLHALVIRINGVTTEHLTSSSCIPGVLAFLQRFTTYHFGKVLIESISASSMHLHVPTPVTV